MGDLNSISDFNSIVVDPTVLNTRRRLNSFLESLLYKRYVAFLPSSLSSLIQMENWKELIILLRRWEWNLDKSRFEEWFDSREFRDSCHRLSEVCVSFERVSNQLTEEERTILSRVQRVLGQESPRIVELAKELVTIATTKNAGIISFSRHIKRWLKNLRRTLIIEITEKTGTFSKAKKAIKDKLKNYGLKGKVFVFFLSVAIGIALENLVTVIPVTIALLLKEFLKESGEEVIVAVLTNGV